MKTTDHFKQKINNFTNRQIKLKYHIINTYGFKNSLSTIPIQ